jgi:hypothetical protein
MEEILAWGTCTLSRPVTLLLIGLASLVLGGLKGVSDVLTLQFDQSVFASASTSVRSWIDPRVSWENKYSASGLLGFLQRTVLVWTTDLFHMVDLSKTLITLVVVWLYQGCAFSEILVLALVVMFCQGLGLELIRACLLPRRNFLDFGTLNNFKKDDGKEEE